MGPLNTLLMLTVLGLFALGMFRAGTVYQDALSDMQPRLLTIQKGMDDHDPTH